MIGENWPVIGHLLGIGSEPLSVWQMALRAAIVYLAALALVRLGEKRFLGKYAALDFILGFVLGSVLSRAITGNAPFFEAIFGGALVTVLMHWLFAVLSFHWDRFGDLVEGKERILVRDGEIEWEAMRRSHIREDDLLAAVRGAGQMASLDGVKEARLERSGQISVIKDERQPRIVEIRVEDGVQTVRLEVD